MTPNWNELIQAYISGNISDADAAVLEAQLKQNAALRDQYLDAVNLDSALGTTGELARIRRTLPPQISEQPIASRAVTTNARFWFGRYFGAAAAVLIAAIFIGAIQWSHRGVMVEIISAPDLPSLTWKTGDTVRVRHLSLAHGSLEMKLPSGVQCKVEAPAVLELISPMELRVASGKITADVGERGTGFVIETPLSRIVDRGTVFGVDASNKAQTDVVVFKGKVDVYDKGNANQLASLNTGQALRVQLHKRASRIESVTGTDEGWSSQNNPAKTAVISAASDSMSTDDAGSQKWPSLRNFYRILPAGLNNRVLAYSDEIDQWQDVPSTLAGADLVRTFAVDSFNRWMELSVTVQKPCELFVFVDKRNEVPEWLSKDFKNIGEEITLNRISPKNPNRIAHQLKYAIWKKTVPHPGEVTLGPPYSNPPADQKSFNPNRMYGVAAKALP